MILALTDQFPDGAHPQAAVEAEKAAARIQDEYKRLYLSDIIRERRGKAMLAAAVPARHGRRRNGCVKRCRATSVRKPLRPAGNDEAVLRWNTCARLLMTIPSTAPDVREVIAIQSE